MERKKFSTYLSKVKLTGKIFDRLRTPSAAIKLRVYSPSVSCFPSLSSTNLARFIVNRRLLRIKNTITSKKGIDFSFATLTCHE
jgi:hypothetical protein